MSNRRTYEKRENVRALGESNKENQLDFLQEASRHPRDTRENVRALDESNKENQPDFLRIKSKSGRDNKFKKALEQLRNKYREQLEEVQAKKEAERSTQQVFIKGDKQFLTTGDGYAYEKITKAYIDMTTGTHTTEITVKVKKDDGAPVETTIPYSGEASAIARLCSEKLDGFIQNNYHDVLAQAKLKIEEETVQAELKIEEEMAPQYVALGSTPDLAARADLDTQRDQKMADLDTERNTKMAEAEKKADAALRKFLEKYGGRRMDAELLEELQWVQGMDAAARDAKGRKAFSEKKLETNAEEMQRITSEISDKIQEIQRILPSFSATSSGNHALADSSHTSSSEASRLSHGSLTLENFEKKLEAYLNNHSRGLSDPFYKEILLLTTDKSQYPESLGSEDKQKIRKMLLDIGLKLVERQYKLDEPLEMLERWERYTASHYGKRLMYERQLIDHLETVVKVAGEHAKAVYQESELVKEAEMYFRAAARRVEIHPVSPGPLSSDLLAQLESIQKKAQDETLDQTERIRHIDEFVNVSLQIRDTLNIDALDFTAAKSLQKALEKLEKARLKSTETKGTYEQANALTEKLQKLIDLEKGRDDADDALDMNKVKAIKESDKTSLQHLRALELEMVKHFYALRLEDHKALNKEEDVIQHFLVALDKIEIGNEIQQKRIKTMYWLALFGSGDQAALMAMGRTSNAEFSTFMRLFS
jgi:hypothetical protein